jgi:transcriptional regulator with GAF, ATPase, and Fis domain
MSSQAIWANTAAAVAGTEAQPGQVTAHIKLNSLREAALAILSQLESLGVSQNQDVSSAPQSLRLYDEVRKFEVTLIRDALNRTGGSQTRAAKLLGVKLTTLNSKIKRYHIVPFGYDAAMNEAISNEQNAA